MYETLIKTSHWKKEAQRRGKNEARVTWQHDASIKKDYKYHWGRKPEKLAFFFLNYILQGTMIKIQFSLGSYMSKKKIFKDKRTEWEPCSATSKSNKYS